MFILDDVDPDRLAFPKQYGIDDVPLIVEDKGFSGDGSFKERQVEGPAPSRDAMPRLAGPGLHGSR